MMITPEQAMEIARTQYRAGQHAAAEATCRRMVVQQPRHAEAVQLLWQIACDAGRFGDALTWILAVPSDSAAWHCDLGLTYRRLDRVEEAVACYERAVALQPDLVMAHLNLSDALHALKRFEEATASCARALALEPNSVEAHTNLAAVLIARHRLVDAERSCERALTLDPRSARAQTNLGIVRFEQGRFEEAIDCLRRAIESRPDFSPAHMSLAGILLLLGRYAEGWREHEWRLRLERPRFSQPRWDGGLALGQTILLHAEQGLGDTIQFLRYIPLVRERSGGERIVLECQPKLARLLASNEGCGVEVVARGEKLPAFDWHLPLLSLPLVLGEFEPRTIAAPYLRVVSRQRREAPQGLRVGLVWAGNPKHARDSRRSLPVEKLLPLLSLPGVTCYDPHGAPMSVLPAVDACGAKGDFADTAAFMMELDLVVTVDTAAAHLAGALGRAVWTLLPFVPDWRWGLEREDTPWYPTMRLFRQRAPGDWDEVIERVRTQLEKMTR